MSKYMKASEFRDAVSRNKVLMKVSKLLQENIRVIIQNENLFKMHTVSDKRVKEMTQMEIDREKKPLLFNLEEAVSCLTIFNNYISRLSDVEIPQSLSAQVREMREQLNEELTNNIANVRAVEFITKAFCIKHRDFESETSVFRQVLQLKCLALQVLSRLTYTSPLVSEIGY